MRGMPHQTHCLMQALQWPSCKLCSGPELTASACAVQSVEAFRQGPAGEVDLVVDSFGSPDSNLTELTFLSQQTLPGSNAASVFNGVRVSGTPVRLHALRAGLGSECPGSCGGHPQHLPSTDRDANGMPAWLQLATWP
jgi:hypothetical protein